MSKSKKDPDLMAHERECAVAKENLARRLLRLEMVVVGSTVGLVGFLLWAVKELLQRLPL